MDLSEIAKMLANNPGAFPQRPQSSRHSLSKPMGARPPAVTPAQPATQQFTQQRMHAQTPDGASARWMELFRG